MFMEISWVELLEEGMFIADLLSDLKWLGVGWTDASCTFSFSV